ncbi:MAG: hypothetical protein ACRD0P_01575, partial [Stackebrandtia sp.]
ILKFAGVGASVLPPDRICIHAGRKVPGNIERQRGGGDGYSLFLDNGLYRSLDAVKLELAHQFTHMRLVIDEAQTLAEAQKCEPLRLDDEPEEPKAKNGKRKAKNDTDYDETAGTESSVDEKHAELEIRTEVASFVLGFGKLILNGAADWDDLEEHPDAFERITTLPLESLVHLYKKVADHADVGSKALESGLTDEAKEALGTAKEAAKEAAKPKKKKLGHARDGQQVRGGAQQAGFRLEAAQSIHDGLP